jgi:putative tryptophan/tyrosine transport system substrate-binding protein
MRRREFIAGLGGAVVWPVVGQAQRGTPPVIGFLTPVLRKGTALETDAFLSGLGETGYAEGRNVVIEYRFLDGFDGMPAAAAELVRRRVAAIFAVSPPAVLAIKAQTATIPVVFSVGEDPVKEGLVANLNRPGRNITGFSNFQNMLGSKKLSLLGELVAKPLPLGILVNPTNPNADPDTKDAQAAASVLGRELLVFTAGTEDELAAAFGDMSRLRIGGLLVNIDRVFLARREYVVTLAARYAIPVLYERRQFAASGGLMSYGASEAEGFRQCGIYMGRILNGANPGDLPVQQPTRLELVINLQTAKALGLTIPETLLATADEVIQ